jgi:hypothetical protein
VYVRVRVRVCVKSQRLYYTLKHVLHTWENMSIPPPTPAPAPPDIFLCNLTIYLLELLAIGSRGISYYVHPTCVEGKAKEEPLPSIDVHRILQAFEIRLSPSLCNNAA